MGTVVKFFLLFSIVGICCKNVSNADVEKSALLYFVYPVSHEISGYEHYLYIGDKEEYDSAMLVKIAKGYTDTLSSDIPVFAIVFLDKLESFPKTLDDQDWSAIRKNFMLELTYDEDSLKVGKYVISRCYKWKDGLRYE